MNNLNFPFTKHRYVDIMMLVLEKISAELDCKIEDIMEFYKIEEVKDRIQGEEVNHESV